MQFHRLTKSLKQIAVLQPLSRRRSESVNPNRKYVPLKLFSNENSLSDLSKFSSFSELSVANSVVLRSNLQLELSSNETQSFYQSDPEKTNSHISLLSTTQSESQVYEWK